MKAGNFYNSLLGSPRMTKLGTGKCPFNYKNQLKR